MKWDYDTPFVMTFNVQAHIDALAHTRNTHYVEWSMETAWAHTTALGLGAAEYQQLDRAMALTHAEYDYLRATRAGDTLLVGPGSPIGAGSKNDPKVTNHLSATAAYVFRGTLEFVCIEISTGQPKKPPSEFIDIYTPALINKP